MKTSISRNLLLGVALTALALGSACSQPSSNAQPQTAAPPAVSAAPVQTVQAAPAMPVAPVTAAVIAKPAIIPSSIAPTSPLAQVVRLAQAGVDESIIMVYVTNSSRTFNLDSEKIIYLTDLGLPTDVVTAMMQRDQELQQGFAAAQAEQQAQQIQQAQQAQQTQQAQTTPAPEPAATSTAETMTPPAPVTVNYFNDTLSPYGSWVVVNGYGNCWRPAVCGYNPTWQPYCDRGHWVYTDCGWYWSSDYAWGATFHYGRWFQAANVGWCWSPDTVWAPSWVTWRYSNNYCGWAPLPPQTYCQAGVGLVYSSGNLSVGLGFGLGASCFTFVPTQYFCSPHPRNYCASPSQATQIYNNTTVINNINIHGSGNNQIVINNGIPVQSIANNTHSPIHPVPVHQIDRGFAHGGSGQLTDRPSRVFAGNHPNPNGGANNPAAQPSMPPRSGPAASAPGQNPPRSTVMTGNGGSRPGQNHFQPPAISQPAQIGQGQFNQAPTRTQPARNNPTATGPQRSVAAANYHAPAYTAPSQAPSANFNSSPRPAPTPWQQTGTPRNYTQNPEPRQHFAAQNPVVAPPVSYTAPAQAQPQPRSYSQPRNEVRQNYSPAPAMAAPQPQRSAPSVAVAPAPQSQNSGGGRMGNQNWGPR